MTSATQGDWQEELKELEAAGELPAAEPLRREPGVPLVLIGLAGKAGAGKDTLAGHWHAAHDALLSAFANPMRVALSVAFGIDLECFFDRELKEAPIEWLGKSPRQLMQHFGTEFGRAYLGDDIWLKVAGKVVEGCRAAPEYSFAPALVFTDVRFDNEAEWIRAQGGWIVHLTREELPRVAAHISESGVSVKAGDIVLTNNGSRAELFETGDAVLEGILLAEAHAHRPAPVEIEVGTPADWDGECQPYDDDPALLDHVVSLDAKRGELRALAQDSD